MDITENIKINKKIKNQCEIINDFYQKLPYYKKKVMYDIINGTSPIKLRFIELFVVNYSKKNNLKLFTDFHIYNNYKKQKEKLNKKYFDIFKRRLKCNYELDYNHNIKINTSIGQLNFFKWLFENEIIDYIGFNFNDLKQKIL